MHFSKAIVAMVHDIFAGGLHQKRVASLGHAVVGAATAAQAGVASIGRAAAAARGVSPKHAIKQFDRFLSNGGFDLEVAMASYLGFVIGSRRKLLLSMDWTEYPDGGHRIALNLVTAHGRATPLYWKTVAQADLAEQRNAHEDELLRSFKFLLPGSVNEVTVLADRGFGDVALYDVLEHELKFHFVIRFRGCIRVETETGVSGPASGWVPTHGKALRLNNAKVTARRRQVTGIVVVKRKAMKDSWILATSLQLPAEDVVQLYARRFTIEENFRDEKDWRFGFGSRYVRITRTDRRDRLCLVLALATVLLTLLGHAGETLGLARTLRANTAKTRTHSLFRQGREYLRRILVAGTHAHLALASSFYRLVAAQHLQEETRGAI